MTSSNCTKFIYRRLVGRVNNGCLGALGLIWATSGPRLENAKIECPGIDFFHFCGQGQGQKILKLRLVLLILATSGAKARKCSAPEKRKSTLLELICATLGGLGATSARKVLYSRSRPDLSIILEEPEYATFLEKIVRCARNGSQEFFSCT